MAKVTYRHRKQEINIPDSKMFIGIQVNDALSKSCIFGIRKCQEKTPIQIKFGVVVFFGRLFLLWGYLILCCWTQSAVEFAWFEI